MVDKTRLQDAAVEQSPARKGSTCPTKLLPDLPADDDAFGSHRRIASGIASLIQNDDGGKAIALTGTWGSGKSTVVKLLQSELGTTNSDDILLFVFDAWAHRGDPLRRVFLENLIAFFSEKDCLKNKKEFWRDETEKIKGQIEDTKILSTPELTNWGKALLASTLFIPLGLARFDHFGPFWGWLLSLLPLWVIVLTFVSTRPILRFWKREFWQKVFDKEYWKLTGQLDSFFYLFFHKTVERVHTKTIRTPEPTSIEFQQTFVLLLDDALGRNQKQFVLVVDNLDRIQTSEALTIWATMRTFLHHSVTPSSAWLSRFWLIVPFDPSALQEFWGDAEGGQATEQSGETVSLAHAFEQKTFQTTFHVPLPVRSDWKKYFQHQLAIALSGHVKESYQVYRLFHVKRRPQGRPPSPREIKLFLNKLAALHLQWGDEISLSVQALYLLVQEEIDREGASQFFKDPKRLGDTTLRIVNEPKLQDLIAALYFNVDPDKALQVRIGDGVERALVEGDFESLGSLVAVPGFEEVCHDLIEENLSDWQQKDPAAIAMAARALGPLTITDDYVSRAIWDRLSRAAREVESWNKFDASLGEGMAQLLRHSPAESTEELAKAFLESVSTLEQKKEETDFPEKWVATVVPLLLEITADGAKELVKNHFKVPLDSDFFIKVIAEVAKRPDRAQIYNYFHPKTSLREVFDKLVQDCQAGKLREEHGYALGVIQEMDSLPWQNLSNAINQRLQASNNLNGSETAGCIRALLALSLKGGETQADDLLKTLSEQGHIAHQLHHAQSQNEAAAIALSSFVLFRYVAKDALQNNVGNSAAGFNFYLNLLKNPDESRNTINQMKELMIQFDQVEHLVIACGRPGISGKLAQTLVRDIGADSEKRNIINSELVVNYHSTLASVLPESDWKELLAYLIRDQNLHSEIQEYDFDRDLAPLYRDILGATEGEEGGTLLEFFSSNIRDLEEDAWLEEFREEGPVLDLLALLTEGRVPLNLGEQCEKALLSHADEVIKGKIKPDQLSEKLRTVFRALTNHWKGRFRRDLWDRVINLGNRPITPIFELHSEVLLKGDLQEYSDQLFRRLFPEIIGRAELDEMQWIERLIEAGVSLDGCPEETRQTFGEQVQNAFSRTEAEPVKTRLLAIGNELGIELEGKDVSKDDEGDSENQEVSE